MFKVFKNKKESDVLDLTTKKTSNSDIPVPEEIRAKIEKTIADSTQTNIVSVADTNTDTTSEIKALNSPTTTEEQKPAGGGGFFSNFFGGGSSSSESTIESESTEETTTESKPISRSNLIKIRDNFQKLSQRIVRLTDRVELLEKKLERMEGR